MMSHWWVYKWRPNVHCMHPGQAPAEDHQSQYQAHNKVIATHTFGCVWTILHAPLSWPSLQYPIPWQLHTHFTCFWVLPDKKSKAYTSAIHTDMKYKARKRKQDRESEIEKVKLRKQETAMRYKRTTHYQTSNSTYHYTNDKLYFNIHSPHQQWPWFPAETRRWSGRLWWLWRNLVTSDRDLDAIRRPGDGSRYIRTSFTLWWRIHIMRTTDVLHSSHGL